ncbi:hypothetical protein GOARA_026_00020 [Gordonia araii NBRC 100433]|uniref:Uncharacterized protein n=1 Tax=Gordonia araii NBRC 100433 TaxID=1073574 RepID=G7GZE8_9ACTN|nr:hypothetical protein GOARA_026_00020 [Gordonia araii NBRC 100433]
MEKSRVFEGHFACGNGIVVLPEALGATIVVSSPSATFEFSLPRAVSDPDELRSPNWTSTPQEPDQTHSDGFDWGWQVPDSRSRPF